MSYRLVDAVLLTPGIPHIPKMVLIALARYADDDGTHARPGNERIEEMMDMSPRSVFYGLRYLKEHRIITPTAHAKGGRGHAVEYRISLERVHHMQGLDEIKGARGAGFAEIKGARGAVKGARGAPHSVMTQSSDPKFDLNGDDPSSRARAHTRVNDSLPDETNPADWQAFYAWRTTTVGQKYLSAQYAMRLGEPMQFAAYRAWFQNQQQQQQQQQEEGEAPCQPISSAPSGSAGARTATASASASTPSSRGPASSARTAANVSRPA